MALSKKTSPMDSNDTHLNLIQYLYDELSNESALLIECQIDLDIKLKQEYQDHLKVLEVLDNCI